MHLKLKIGVLLLLLISWHIEAQTESRLPEREVNLPSLYISVADILQTIQNSGINISYSSTYLNLTQKLKFNSNTQKLRTLLLSFLNSERIEYLSDKVLLLPPKTKNISGFVYDATTKEALIGAIIYNSNSRMIGVTNEFGFYNVSVPWSEEVVSATYIGYLRESVKLDGKQAVNILLAQNTTLLSELTVIPKNISEPFATSVVDMKQPGYIPSMLGGDDVIARFHDIAGVSSQNFSQPLSVRNDLSDNNLVLLDGIPVYSYMHIFSIFSIFNSDAIQKATLYKGLFPARYEGRLGAVLDIRMKDGNKNDFAGSVNADLGTISVLAEGPIEKQKSSFMVNARRSWLDALPLFSLTSTDKLNFSVFDLYLKLNFRTGDRNQFYVSNYLGGDLLDLNSSDDTQKNYVRWNNLLSAVRWNHVFSDQWFVNTTLSYSFYRNVTQLESFLSESGSSLGNHVSNITLTSDFENKINNWLKMSFGYKMGLSDYYTPIVYGLSGEDRTFEMQHRQSMKVSLYYEAETELTEKWNIRSGFNYVNYFYKPVRYAMFEPRVQLGYRVGENTSFFSGYSKTGQFYHQLTLPQISMPFELRIASSDKIRPASSNLFEIGSKIDLTKKLTLSGSLFYKHTSDLLAYRVTQDVSTGNIAPNPENRVAQGKSKAWGVEFESTYTSLKWRIHLAYTYSSSKMSYPSVDKGVSFYPEYDVPHQFKTAVAWNLSKKSTLTGRISASSGLLINFPIYSLPSIESLADNGSSLQNYYISGYNTRRLPASYRLDLGYSLTDKGFTKGSLVTMKVGFNNLWGKNNYFAYSPSINYNRIKLELQKLSNFIPYFGVSYKF